MLNPGLLTDFRFGFFRYHVNVFPNGVGTTPAKDAGIPGLNLGDPLTSGMPQFFIQGQEEDEFSSAVLQLSRARNRTAISMGEQLDRNHREPYLNGAPIFVTRKTFGWPLSPLRHLDFFNSRTQGPSGGGLGLATFLLGDVSFFGRVVNSITMLENARIDGISTAKIPSVLPATSTLSYGLRWEIYFPQSVTGKGAGGWVDLNTGLIKVAGYGNMNLQGT